MEILNPLDHKHLGYNDTRILSILYNEPHRFYHNIEHISNMYSMAIHLGYDLNLEERAKIYYAICWHDAVYNPGEKDNEYNSAALFGDFSDAPEVIRDDVYKMILASKDHFNPKHDEEDFLTKLFLDLDIYELGMHPVVYQRNSENLFKEFAAYKGSKDLLDIWNVGRKKWIESVLDKEKIFRCDFGDESMARYNLETELKGL